MDCKKYLNTFWMHLVMVLFLSGICVCLALQGNWLWLSVALLTLVWAVWKFHRFYTSNTRKVAFLLDAIENNDPAIHFYERIPDKDSSQVNVMLNRIARMLQTIKRETVEREKYYELILDFVETGIVVLDEKGVVVQKNRKALELLGMEVFTHVKQLGRLSESIEKTFREILPGQKMKLEYTSERGTITPYFRASSITIQEKSYRIIAMDDISHELDEREIDSWIRLTRVLTHEMMNSLTPVTSLSEMLLTLPGAQKDEELRQGLDTIRTTGQGLVNFVKSYRRLTRLPSPEPILFDVRPFLERMVQLAKHQYPLSHVRITLEEVQEDLMAFADESMMTQVMTNLLKNAVQAIGDAENGEIRLHAFVDGQDVVRIEVSNNGPRIIPEVAAQMFVPFFTTKEEGSGIGLSLCKQMMRLQGGNIALLPYRDEWTTFVVML
ncbi:MAG: GHKL domain-containing protein [Bacteroidaceae bacterium]|nr:GHKL domain-containing protein [Bacteroidaceae bacterium]